MRHFQQTSGDLVADRRAAWADGLARDKDFAAAAEVMAQALDLVPEWAAGWCLYGDYLREAGDTQRAIGAFRRLQQVDAAGIFGADLKLAALRAGDLPTATAVPYVEALFDDYASRFETELIDGLGYAAPQALAALIVAELDRRTVTAVRETLDLGCGTGLMGVALGARAGRQTGIDLSAGMLAEAARKGCYAELIQGELLDYLSTTSGRFELITAADVLNYVGPLGPVLEGAARVLAKGGLMAFTLERHSGAEPLVLRETLRYAHAPTAVDSGLATAGLSVLRMTTATLRHDRGVPVEGLLVLAVRD